MQLRPTRYDHPDAIALTELVQRYYVEIYGGPDGELLTPERLSAPSGGFFVGYEDDRPVAMGGWVFDAGTPRPTDAQIRRMFTLPQARRSGYGRLLLQTLEADAASQGATRMVLSTGSPQVPAVALYRACGYVDIEPFGFYGDKAQIVCLAKPLD